MHKSLSPHSLLPLTRPPHDPNHLNSKISGFKPSLPWVLKINSYVSRAGKEYFFIGFSPHLSFVTDWKTYLHALQILGLALRGCIVAFVHDYCCRYLHCCTDSSRKKKTHLFLTTEWRVVQSSWSILEQYMGRWPKAIIQGLLARFSGLFASLRSFVNHSTCSATEPLVK